MPNSLPMEFEYSTSTQSLSVELINNDPWFLAKDVCDSLGLENVTKALYSLDEDEKLTLPVVRSGQTREMNFVNESGLYNLIFQSRKPEAKKFRKWVTSEVLPSIRKTGKYAHVSPNPFTSNGISDILEYCEKRSHDGEVYYAAIHLRALFGKFRNGSTTKILHELLATNEALKLPPNAIGAKWYVKKSAIGKILNIKPTNLINISILKSLNAGGLS
jgi:hypothetical protein